MGTMTSLITSITIVYSSVYSGSDQRKYQSSASLAFVKGIHRWPVNSPHKGPVKRKMFPFDDVIMCQKSSTESVTFNVEKWLQMQIYLYIFSDYIVYNITKTSNKRQGAKSSVNRLFVQQLFETYRKKKKTIRGGGMRCIVLGVKLISPSGRVYVLVH